VRHHAENVFSKLGVQSRRAIAAQLDLWAVSDRGNVR
jgi:DNA-binding CsgD family transcriptional regulator